MEAKAKVLDVLYPKDRTTKTVERSFPKKVQRVFASVEGRRKRSQDSFGKRKANES